MDSAFDDYAFDEAAYLRRYPDVAAAVERREISSGLVHYKLHGRAEGRTGTPRPPKLDVPRWWVAHDDDKDRLGRYDRKIAVRSIDDLNRLTSLHLARLAGLADLVVGIPRSGLLAANIVALHLNLPLLTLDAFLKREFIGSKFTHRSTKAGSVGRGKPRVLLVDDSIGTGRTFDLIEQSIDQAGLKSDFFIHFLAVYSTTEKAPLVDHLEVLDHPRAFEWNVMHHDYTKSFCVDLDGVLCADPTVDENDDGDAYSTFIRTARPKIIPSRGVGAVVTARLERYRTGTEDWLARCGVQYERLIMLDLPTGAERRRLGAHAKYKADVYNELGGRLFVESDLGQAKEIFNLTGRPVYSLEGSVFML